MTQLSRSFSRREAIKCGLFTGVSLAASRVTVFGTNAPQQLPLISRTIPSTGERIPVVGVGTIRFGENEAQDIAPLHQVLRRLPQLGGLVVDTARSYNRSEIVIGEFFDKIGHRDELFLATKVPVQGNDVKTNLASFEESFRRLKTDRIDLMQVHNVAGAEMMLPVLREWKQEGRIRYIGITAWREVQHEELLGLMRRQEFDFVQINYSLDDRVSAEKLLPLAADRGMAVLINVPFGKASLFAKVAGKPLPDWAAEIDCRTWAQVLLKYVVSHPAVTCTIPGTTKVAHLEDNLEAARGRLPDASVRQRMERYWDSLA
ncbi:MAG: aldo/keto reductase [Vicinamibacterales bacterium]|nr:aldo/keto reductase [Vicinamibacterales bacterium]